MNSLPKVASSSTSVTPDFGVTVIPRSDDSQVRRRTLMIAPPAPGRRLQVVAQRAALETSVGRSVLLDLFTGEYTWSTEHLSGAAALRADATLRHVAFVLLVEGPGPVEFHRLQAHAPTLAPDQSLWSALCRLRVLRMIWISRAVSDLRPMAFGLTKLGEAIVAEALFRPVLAELVTDPF